MGYISVLEREKTMTPTSSGYVPVAKRKATSPVLETKTVPTAPVKKPFDATTGGFALNTLKGVLGMVPVKDNPWLNVAKNIGQGIARTVGTVGITAANLANKNSFDQSIPTNNNPISNAIIGGKPINTIQQEVANVKKFTEPYIGKTGANLSALPLVGLGIALDLSMFGGGKAVTRWGEVPEQFFKFVAKEEKPAVIKSILRTIGLDERNAKLLAPELAKTKTVDEAKTVLTEFGKPKKLSYTPVEEHVAPSVKEQIAILEDRLVEHPGVALSKRVSRTTGLLPEVTGKSTMTSLTGSGKTVATSEYGKRGDDIAQELLQYRPGMTPQEAVDEVKQIREQINYLKSLPKDVKLIPTEGLPDRPSDISPNDWRIIQGVDTPTASERTFWRQELKKVSDSLPKNQQELQNMYNSFRGTNPTLTQEVDALKKSVIKFRDKGGFVGGKIINNVPHLKFDSTGNPLAYTSREQAIVNKSVPFLPRQVQMIPPTSEGKSFAQIAQQEGYNIPKEYQKPKEYRLHERVYEANRNAGEVKTSFREHLKEYRKDIGKGTDKILGVISTRLKNMNPQLKRDIRNFEYKLSTATQRDVESATSFMRGFKKLKGNDQMDLDLALKNSDTYKINEIAKRNNLDLAPVRKVLDDLYKRATDIGYEVPYLGNYFPRQIKDSKKFMEYLESRGDWKQIDELIKAKEIELDRYLTAEEKATLVNLNTHLAPGEKMIFETGSMRPRTIEIVDAEINKFYTDSNTALSNYIESTNDAIESWKFFSENKKTKFTKIDDTIGTYVLNKLADGTIKPSEAKELGDILTARFKQQGTHGIVSLYKDLAYIDTMGSPISTLTQLGDPGFTVYRTGIFRTTKAILKAFMNKSEIKNSELGIHEISQEFRDSKSTAKSLKFVFDKIGLTKITKIFQEGHYNAIIAKYRKLALKPTPDFMRRLEDVFGKDTGQILYDLKSGKVTEDIKLLAFNEILDIQPIKASEMPEQYLKGGNGRIFYMLKTYTIKLYDVYRNEVFAEIARGNKWKGIKNLILLSASLIAANATADEIKDLILGRKTSLKDRTVDNLLRLVGFTKWTVYKARQEGLPTAVLQTTLPPMKFFNALYKDITKGPAIKDLETFASVPFIGKFYYYWFGKGAPKEKSTSSEKKLKTPVGLPEIPSLNTLPKLPGLPKLP